MRISSNLKLESSVGQARFGKVAISLIRSSRWEVDDGKISLASVPGMTATPLARECSPIHGPLYRFEDAMPITQMLRSAPSRDGPQANLTDSRLQLHALLATFLIVAERTLFRGKES